MFTGVLGGGARCPSNYSHDHSGGGLVPSVNGLTCFLRRAGFAGTPGYLSPEVLRKDPYGKPVDIWACGESSLSAVTTCGLVAHVETEAFQRCVVRNVFLLPSQVLSSTSCWWGTLHFGTKISTNCTSRSKLEPMT